MSRGSSGDDEYKSDFDATTDEETSDSAPPEGDDSLPFLVMEETRTSEWIAKLSLKAAKLTLHDILLKCRPDEDNVEDGVDIKVLDREREKLNRLLGLHMARKQWLLSGSRKTFGQLHGRRVAVIFDMSIGVNEFDSLESYLHNLQDLVLDQMSRKEIIHLAGISAKCTSPWNNSVAVNSSSIRAASSWIRRQRPRCRRPNVLSALEQVFQLSTDWDSICLILASTPSQKISVIRDFVCESLAGSSCVFHACAYATHDPDTITFLRELADLTSGTFHRFLETFVESPDLLEIDQEICRAQEVLHTVDKMRSDGQPMSLFLLVKELLKDGEWNYKALPLSELLVYPLEFKYSRSFFKQAMTSQRWLHQNGLRAKQLSLYQVLGPNAVPQMDAYVPIIDKTVRAHVHDDYMAKLVWHDGSIRHVHVDPRELRAYQGRLEKTVKTFEKRSDWLLSGSRSVFGVVAETRVGLLVDTSFGTLESLTKFQEHFRLFLEEQLLAVDSFAIAKFASEAELWKDGLVCVNEALLNNLWRWTLSWDYGGSCDLLNALKIMLESEDEKINPFDLDAVYVILSGHPNQTKDEVLSYLDEQLAGSTLPIHVIIYDERTHVDQPRLASKESPRYFNEMGIVDYAQSLADLTGGRYHKYSETLLVEGDDSTAIREEIERTKSYYEKTSQLLERCEQIKRNRLLLRNEASSPVFGAAASPTKRSSPIPKEPRETASSLARKTFISETYAEKPSSSLVRPKSAPQAQARYLTHLHCYTGFRNDKTTSIDKLELRKPKSVDVKSANIPNEEELFSSKKWLKKYGLSRLNLDLDRLVSNMDSGHKSEKISTLDQEVSAQHCCGIPIVAIKGVSKHLRLRPFELLAYESQLKKVIRRYEKRLNWLASGSFAIFGSVVEKQIVLLVDVSGSMKPNIEHLKVALAALVWEQLHGNEIQFDIVSFASESLAWQGKTVEPSEDNCSDAIKFISGFRAEGNTNTLMALKLAFQISGATGIYLITNGRPDHSIESVLEAVGKLNGDRGVRINTVSFDCNDKQTNEFLKQLSTQNKGRFHRCVRDNRQKGEETPTSMHRGDDLRSLANEVHKAKRFLSESQSYRELLLPTKKPK